jgi:hypothetical protein
MTALTCAKRQANAQTTITRSYPVKAMRDASHFVVVLIVASAMSSHVQARDGAPSMVDNCKALERGAKKSGQYLRIPNTRESLLCWGYMQAMQDISVLVTPEGDRLIGSCPPEQTTLLQLIHVFVRHERSNPRDEQGNAGAAVIKAFQDEFPCHQQRASTRK